jgi:diphosphomevalonate decarboxylase
MESDGAAGAAHDDGKLDDEAGLPATPSLAVSLGGLSTQTAVRLADTDSVAISGEPQEPARFAVFFDRLRAFLGTSDRFEARSVNSFPTASGLASSSSGFAALAGACAHAAARGGSAARELTLDELSEAARAGSVSAARAVFGGFALLPAGARAARLVHGPGHWPDLRIVVAITERGPKPVGSRAAMEETRAHSPYYGQWVAESPALLPQALQALEKRDLEMLGDAMRWSYSLMHAAILATRPPLLYWLPATVAVIRACEELRRKGISAWETIDAGPQVKILCVERDAEIVSETARRCSPGITTVTCTVGAGLAFGSVVRPRF